MSSFDGFGAQGPASGERRTQKEPELTSRLPYSGMASPPNLLRGTCCTAALLSVNRGVADASPRAPIAFMASILPSTTPGQVYVLDTHMGYKTQPANSVLS